jgi:Cupin domain
MAAARLGEQEILSRRKETRTPSVRRRNGTGASRIGALSLSGSGIVRHRSGKTAVEAGDAFLFKPNEPHQVINDRREDLILYIVADNPVGESCHYPDSEKWAVKAPEYRIMRGEALDYYDGEER